MEKALRMQEQMALEKFKNMNSAQQYRVRERVNALAKEKGYTNGKELREEKPYIWKQLCAQVVQKLD